MHWSTFDNISGYLEGLKVRIRVFEQVNLTVKLERAVEKQMLGYKEISLTPTSLVIREFENVARAFKSLADLVTE